MMQKHMVLTAASMVLALLLLAWIRPGTSPGAVFLVALVVLVVNAAGALVTRPSAGKTDGKPDEIPLAPHVST